MAKKLTKAERKEARLRKGKQWLLTYTGSPKKMNKHYRDRCHVDAVTAAKELQELGVVDSVEELRQVEVHDPDVTLICDIEGLVNGRPATPARAKAMTVQTEYWFVFVAQFLRDRLLDDSIDSSWNSQRSELAFLLLRDHDSAYGLRFVFPRLHGFHYLDGVRTQIVQELVYGHAVDARTASVCLDLLISSVQVVPIKDGF